MKAASVAAGQLGDVAGGCGTGGVGVAGREGGGEPPERMCWTVAFRMCVAERNVAACGCDVSLGLTGGRLLGAASALGKGGGWGRLMTRTNGQ